MKAARAFKLLRRLGPLASASALWQHLGDKALIRLRVPGLPHPLFARKHTSDGAVFDQVFLQRTYLFDLPNPNPALIIDAGANVGYTSVFFANRYPSARILAIEPEPSNFAVLAQNVAPYPNIEPIQAALWKEHTFLKIDNPEEDTVSIRVEATAAGQPGTLEAVTMLDLLERAGRERVDLLKMDIEGAERELFEPGCEVWLDRVDTIVIELHDRMKPGCSPAFYRALTRYDFTQYPQGENLIVTLHRP